MILSVSRRTDIPNYYSDWFYQRMKEGFVLVKNPMNPHQVSRISLTPDLIDCIVFWTKNPKKMMGRLDELKDYSYYFQFTITGYGRDVEPNLPSKREEIIPTFIELSKRIGKERVVLRYDPILVSEKYTVSYHIKAFNEIVQSLCNYTELVVISFIDIYQKTKRNSKDLKLREVEESEIEQLCEAFAFIAHSHGLRIETCAEHVDCERFGISHGCCIDSNLIERIIHEPIYAKKDKNQRMECGCIESIDIGTYHTCPNACKYCYANDSIDRVKKSASLYRVDSPILCGELGKEDRVIDRKMKSFKG